MKSTVGPSSGRTRELLPRRWVHPKKPSFRLFFWPGCFVRSRSLLSSSCRAAATHVDTCPQIQLSCRNDGKQPSPWPAWTNIAYRMETMLLVYHDFFLFLLFFFLSPIGFRCGENPGNPKRSSPRSPMFTWMVAADTQFPFTNTVALRAHSCQHFSQQERCRVRVSLDNRAGLCYGGETWLPPLSSSSGGDYTRPLTDHCIESSGYQHIQQTPKELYSLCFQPKTQQFHSWCI